MTNILEIKNLKKNFPLQKGIFSQSNKFIPALNNVNLSIKQGEIIGIAGESGCGKTTLGRCIAALENPTSGEILFENIDIKNNNTKQMKNFRTKVQVVFQNPYASLNPKMTIGEILKEPLNIYHYPKKDIEKIILEKINLVGLQKSDLYRYPHEFSGGQKQRIAIARALMLTPKLIIADEPVSALDVSIQAQIINLLLDLKEKLNLTIIFISHDLSVIRHISDKVAIMYLGEIIEYGSTQKVFDTPMHPYTKLLLSAVPQINTKKKIVINTNKMELPNLDNLPIGCKFSTRCEFVTEFCKNNEINYVFLSAEHYYKCILKK